METSLLSFFNSTGNLCDPMPGVPQWIAFMGFSIIVLSTFVLVNSKKSDIVDKSYWKINLLKWTPFKSFLKKSYFPILAQSIPILLLILVLSAGLFGNQRNNIAPVLTWTWWWILLIFLVLGFGKAFCTICPWEGLSSLITSFSFTSRIKQLGFEMKWPKWAKNIYPAIILFVILTWLELGLDVTRSPSLTAILGLAMTSLAILSAILFERRGFCRYGCLVGRISGIYALFSPFELRPESKEVCVQCKDKSCNTGTDIDTNCPTFLFPGNLKENSYCTLCTECIRSCSKDNIALNIRPLGKDLFHKEKFRWDEAVLSIVLLTLTSFHGVTMTPIWISVNDFLMAETGLTRPVIFTFLMILMMAIPFLLFWLSSVISWRLTHREMKPLDILKAFAYPLIPIALFYHLAHNGMHFFTEFLDIIPLLSDPFAFGWDLFGTASKSYDPFLSITSIWWLQVILIVIGHIFAVLIANKIAKKIFDKPKQALMSLIPVIITMVIYSGFSIWLIAQPMEMRIGM